MASRFTIPKAAVPRLPAPYHSNPIYKEQPPASPLHLSGDLLLTPGASGAVEPSKLVNPMGQDMEIIEIKFTISSEPSDDATGGGGEGGTGPSVAPVFGGSIQCELKLGDVKVTNGAIPVWNFARAENVYAERLLTGGNLQLDVPVNYYSVFSWRLPRPLFVPAGSVLSAQFSHTGLVAEPLHVRIGYSARTVFVQPKVVCVPWVAAYISKAFNVFQESEAIQTDSSTPWQLVNANPELLNLQRFVGRTLLRGSIADDNNQIFYENYPQVINSQNLVLRIIDSYGRPVVGNFVPWQTVINSPTRSWELENGSIMDPFAFFRTDLRFSVAFPDEDSADGTYQSFLSFIGWREVKP